MGDIMQTTSTNIQTLVDEYLTFLLERRNRRPLTVQTYRHALKHFVRWCEHNQLTLEGLEPDDIEAFGWRTLRNGGMPSAATARASMVATKKFLDWCVARKHIPITGHLDLVTPSQPDSVPNPIADTLWRALWGSDLCPDDRLWLGDAYWLGRRRYEIVTTRPEGVLPELQQIRFERKRGKIRQIEYQAVCQWLSGELPWLTEGWTEWVQLLEETSEQRSGERYLSVYAETGQPDLDGNRLTKRLWKLCDAAGLERFGPHRLRHSACTNFFRAGVEPAVIQNLMGHESFDTTRGYMSISGYLQRGLDRKAQANG